MSFTRDGIFDRRITVYQPRKGYRFSVDSVLLGCFAVRGRAVRALDLGSGSGVVGFILLAHGGAREVAAVEMDPTLVEASRMGARENGLTESYRVIQGDLRDPAILQELDDPDLVVSNPPYHSIGSGLVPDDESIARARHEGTCTLDDVVGTASAVLRERGRLCVVLPPERMGKFVSVASSGDLHLSRIWPIYPAPGRDSRMVLIETRKKGARLPCALEPPLVLHDGHGEYTPEARDLLWNGPRSG